MPADFGLVPFRPRQSCRYLPSVRHGQDRLGKRRRECPPSSTHGLHRTLPHSLLACSTQSISTASRRAPSATVLTATKEAFGRSNTRAMSSSAGALTGPFAFGQSKSGYRRTSSMVIQAPSAACKLLTPFDSRTVSFSRRTRSSSRVRGIAPSGSGVSLAEGSPTSNRPFTPNTFVGFYPFPRSFPEC